MTKYIIKTTYLEGEHEGKVHYLNKGGYVVDDLIDNIWQDESYTLSACKAACTRKAKSNKINRDIELRDRERRMAQGKPVSPYRIYYLEKFEPFAIETVDE